MTMKQVFLIFIFTVSFSLSSFAQNVFNKAKMDSLITALEKNDKAMGVLALSQNGHVIYKKAFGYKQISGKVRNNTDTKFRIGSITKMFTATMILQLIEENKLALQNKLDAYFPEVQNANEITIEQMLTHHSGLHNFTDSAYLKYHTKPKTQKEMLGIISSQSPDFKPGERGEYSNTNYVLLGYIIEKVTGKSYAENLKNRIAKKIKLKDTYVGGKINPKDNEAYSYSYNGVNWIEENETDMSIPGGAGSIVSTSEDLLKFIASLFHEKLIDKALLDTMTTIGNGYGMGIFQVPFYERKGYSHNGSIDGFNSALAYFPEDDMAVAVLTNGLAYEMNDIMIGVLSIYFDKPYAIPEFKKATQLGVGLLPRYTGVYASKDFPLKITIRQDGDHLTAQATGQGAFPLSSINETEFRFDAAGVVILFDIEKDGTVKQLHLQQRGMSYLFEKE